MLPGDIFEAKLLEAIAPYEAADCRLYDLLMAGRCPYPVVQRYAKSTYLSAELFCATVAELADKAPNYKAKYLLLRNAMEEEGIVLKPSKGLVHRPNQRHPALAKRFARACGVVDSDLESGALHATSPGRGMLAQGKWVEAVAFLLIGQELKFGTASGQLLEAFRKYGLSDRDLAFFALHQDADMRHGQEALDLVVENASTAELQQAAIVAAGDGTRLWFEMHGGRAKQRQDRNAAQPG
jgi:pyrroloquinoline quinone (PQQ) biosynthesis protein C